MSRLFAFARDQQGAAATEMALIIPLLLVLMFVGFEAGHFFYTEQKVIKAVREGARFAGRQPFASFPCDGSANATTVSNIQQVTRTGTLSGSVPRVRNMALTDVVVTYRCDSSWENQGIFKGTSGGAPIVLVEASAKYDSLFEQLGLIDSSYNVRASAEAVVSGI